MLSCISFAYLPVIFGIKKIMQSLPPFKNTFSNYLLGSWNLFLSTGSLIGAYYTLPYLVNDIQTHGLVNSVCMGNYRTDDIVSHAVILFNLSKFFEFIDTLFIVFRKSNFEFLHYYHHIFTCIYCWNSGYLNISSGVYFAGINLFIHSIMYFYYALLAFNIQILTPYKKIITVLQTTQMGIGSYIIVLWLTNCQNQYNIYHLLNHIISLGMYISYGFLFSLLLFSSKKRQM